MNTQIIYFHFKGFFVPFMTLHGIGFKFFAKIIKGSSVFCCSNCINVNPTSHRKGILQWKTFNILYTTLYTILSQTPGVKLKRIFECILRIPSSARRCNINSKAWKLWNVFPCACRSISSECVHQISWKNNREEKATYL